MLSEVRASARRKHPGQRISIWVAMLNRHKDLWRAYAINAETKFYVARGPIREGATNALKALKSLLQPAKRRTVTKKKTAP